MAQELSQRLGLPWLSKDAIKEKLYDTVGFRSRAEKVALGEGALEALYYAAGQLLQAGVPCILENNFEEVSKPGLLALLERCQCQAVTVFLTGEPVLVDTTDFSTVDYGAIARQVGEALRQLGEKA